jgi:hypothetical protein
MSAVICCTGYNTIGVNPQEIYTSTLQANYKPITRFSTSFAGINVSNSQFCSNGGAWRWGWDIKFHTGSQRVRSSPQCLRTAQKMEVGLDWPERTSGLSQKSPRAVALGKSPTFWGVQNLQVWQTRLSTTCIKPVVRVVIGVSLEAVVCEYARCFHALYNTYSGIVQAWRLSHE